MVSEQAQWQESRGAGQHTYTSNRQAANVDGVYYGVAQVSEVLCAEECGSGWRLEIWMEDVPTQIGAVKFEGAETDEQKEEPAIITLAETVVDPWAVVVEFGDASVAQRAVLATSWFGDVASTT